MKASRLLITALLCLLLPSVAVATTVRDPMAQIARKHKPHHKRRVVRHHPGGHHPAHTYVYTFAFPQSNADSGNCSSAPYTFQTNIGPANGSAGAILHSYPLVTILDQPGQTIFRITNQPGDPNNVPFVQNICDFAAPNGDQNCGVLAEATYHALSPVKSIYQLLRRPAYSITGVVGNAAGPYLCGSTQSREV
jgi:hypothetical protein